MAAALSPWPTGRLCLISDVNGRKPTMTLACSTALSRSEESPMTKSITLEAPEQLYLAVHEHQYGATLYLFRWVGQGALLFTDHRGPPLADQLGINYEPELDEHLLCFPFDDIMNLRQPPVVSLAAASGRRHEQPHRNRTGR